MDVRHVAQAQDRDFSRRMANGLSEVSHETGSSRSASRLKPVQTGTPTYRLTGVPVGLYTQFQKIQYLVVLIDVTFFSKTKYQY